MELQNGTFILKPAQKIRTIIIKFLECLYWLPKPSISLFQSNQKRAITVVKYKSMPDPIPSSF